MTTWTRTTCEDGVVLRAGESWIRIRPRVHSLIDARTLVARTIATLDAPASVAHEPLRTLITPEGELATVGGARCTTRGRDVECTVVIVGDEPALCLQALGEPGLARDHALALTRELGIGLGGSRRRWFRYDPPPGWFGVRRPGATVWLHPAHPREPAIATVCDARPFVAGDAERFDRFVLLTMGDDFVARGEPTVSVMTTAHGIGGSRRMVLGTRGGRDLVRVAVAGTDDQFSYLAHFEGTNDAATLEAVHRMIQSIRPLPQARLANDAFAMWEA